MEALAGRGRMENFFGRSLCVLNSHFYLSLSSAPKPEKPGLSVHARPLRCAECPRSDVSDFEHHAHEMRE
ncbi:hypothetical protein, partial [Salmonella enterica]|uniref:hypothetical protein n=1 Tax=Salmonella enterica TaxID=28901 RepID=UPI003296F96C